MMSEALENEMMSSRSRPHRIMVAASSTCHSFEIFMTVFPPVGVGKNLADSARSRRV
jgi:hypothetical protein